MKFESSNLGMKGFNKVSSVSENTMSINGTVNKTMFLLMLVFISSVASWSYLIGNPDATTGFLIGGLLVGLVLALVIIFKPTLAPTLSPVYAIVEGFVLGPITMLFEAQYPGIAIQAIMVTIGVFMGILIMYRNGTIRVTDKFRKTIMGAMFGILIIYLISIVARLFGSEVPLIHENGIVGIGFSLVVVGVAALSLALDFDFIEKGVENNLPRYMEWYGAFGLLVTIVWLYLEILKLIAKIRGNN